MKLKNLLIAASLVALSAVSAAQAAILVDFKSDLNTAGIPEFQTDGAFENSTGSISNGLGVPGGLFIETPLTIPGPIVGKTITPTGTTQFEDVTLVLNAPITATVPFGPFVFRFLATGGSFAFYASNPGNPTAGTLLLSGLISPTATVQGPIGGATGGFNDENITYTGGAILAVLGGNPLPGKSSISLNDITPSIAVPFTANGTGLFSTPVIPEAGSTTLLGAASGLLLLARRRR